MLHSIWRLVDHQAERPRQVDTFGLLPYQYSTISEFRPAIPRPVNF
jgi:hypothetical protein